MFQQMQEPLNVSFDRFIRTSDADHYESSKAIWQRMNDAGDIYLGSYLAGTRATNVSSPRTKPKCAPTAAATPARRERRSPDRGTDALPAVGLLYGPTAGALRGEPELIDPTSAATRVVSFGVRGLETSPSPEPPSTGRPFQITPIT